MPPKFNFHEVQFALSFVTCVFGVISKKWLPNQYCEAFTQCFFLRVLAPTFRSLIHFELIFYVLLGKGLASFFCMWISGFPSTVYCKHSSFVIEWSWHPCQKSLTMYAYFWILLHCSICLTLCQSHTVFCFFNWSMLIYNVLLITLYSKVIQLYIYIYFLNILFHYGLSQDIEYSSLCYTVGPCCLSILYIKAYIC